MMPALAVLEVVVLVAALVAMTRSARRARLAQRPRDAAFDRWIAAGGNEAALHEESGSPTVVVLDVRPVPRAADGVRALPNGVRP